MTHTTTGDTAPIACSLSEPDYRRRVQDAGDVARQALRARRPVAGGARLTFARLPGVRGRLEALIAAESDCCSFLTLHLTDDADDLVLTVTGPAEAAAIIEDLFG